MSTIQTQAIGQDKFLLMSANLLHRKLIEPSRTASKRVYRELAEGQPVLLANVEMEDKSQARFTLALEHSEYQGRLNFGAFRASVAALLNNIAAALKEEKELRTFNAQEGSGAMIFGITAVTLEGGKPNVMVLAANPGEQDETTKLQLMYLDPSQFAAAEAAPQSTESKA